MKTALVLLVAALAFAGAAKTFDRCSLARELDRLGVPRSELPQWTCIAEHESTYRTWIVGPPNTDGSNDFGIFQINGLYWCQPPDGRFSHNACRVDCNSLLADDIANSVRCAQQVKREQGWAAWSAWKYCNGALPSTDNCF